MVVIKRKNKVITVRKIKSLGSFISHVEIACKGYYLGIFNTEIEAVTKAKGFNP